MLASAKLLAIDNSIRCRVGWGNLNEEKISTFADNYLDNYRKAVSYAIDRTALCASVMTSDEPANRLTAPSEAGVTVLSTRSLNTRDGRQAQM